MNYFLLINFQCTKIICTIFKFCTKIKTNVFLSRLLRITQRNFLSFIKALESTCKKHFSECVSTYTCISVCVYVHHVLLFVTSYICAHNRRFWMHNLARCPVWIVIFVYTWNSYSTTIILQNFEYTFENHHDICAYRYFFSSPFLAHIYLFLILVDSQIHPCMDDTQY